MVVGAALMAAMVTFPPWTMTREWGETAPLDSGHFQTWTIHEAAGYHWIGWQAPSAPGTLRRHVVGFRVDTMRLAIQLIGVVAVGGGAFLIAGRRTAGA